MLDQIKARITRKLYEMTFADVADMEPVTFITSSTGSLKNSHSVTLASGTLQNGVIEGKDTEGRNIHLPAKYIIDVN